MFGRTNVSSPTGTDYDYKPLFNIITTTPMIVTTGGFPNKLPEMTRKEREFMDTMSSKEFPSFPSEEISDKNPESRDIEPEISDYDVDVLDDKNTWKPRLVFENKTTATVTTTTPSVIMRIGPKNIDVELFNVEAAPFKEGKLSVQ